MAKTEANTSDQRMIATLPHIEESAGTRSAANASGNVATDIEAPAAAGETFHSAERR
ncbi:hypothetical protein J19TS2_54450 [Cohnella xylanilytica]|nr:hypothetical protein J19TS2_54450 [Cohnella xylanilytica]